jgi:hypothetical protein
MAMTASRHRHVKSFIGLLSSCATVHHGPSARRLKSSRRRAVRKGAVRYRDTEGKLENVANREAGCGGAEIRPVALLSVNRQMM